MYSKSSGMVSPPCELKMHGRRRRVRDRLWESVSASRSLQLLPDDTTDAAVSSSDSPPCSELPFDESSGEGQDKEGPLHFFAVQERLRQQSEASAAPTPRDQAGSERRKSHGVPPTRLLRRTPHTRTSDGNSDRSIEPCHRVSRR